MALETAVPMGDGVVLIVDRDRHDFTASVGLSRADIVAILKAMDPESYDVVIAEVEQVKAKARVAANLADRRADRARRDRHNSRVMATRHLSEEY